ncbi:putative NAD/FAD-dependent oxidoreductase [Hoeflea sp. IMCC20628]|nr:putative NAD/FAD-dependent oxidoreductase [Hoeflea sp. IMCC20628]
MIDADILVIGAGLAGLSLARYLVDSHKKVLLLEKSRSPGGRLSTRRSEHGDFDHGAQYITSRTPEFTALVNQLTQSGKSSEWAPDGKDSARPWWVGQPGMSTLGKALAQGLDIRLGAQATRILRQGGGFVVHAKNSDGTQTHFSASKIVAAIPAPQAHALLGPLDPAFAPLDKVGMAPCWTAMLAFDAALDSVPDLIRGQPGDVLGLIVRNGSKPGRTGETYVLHATPEWSKANLQNHRETVALEMIKAMRETTGLGSNHPEPVHFELHRWLYALVEKPLGQPFLANSDNTLFACGDWCIEARAEAAHQSGLALANHIISL